MVDPFSVYFWIRTTERRQGFPAIATNKGWDDGSVFDYTDSHNYGFSLTSGSLAGWAIVLQPNGAWAWNIGDGKQRLDYQPTGERQTVSDGKWHLLAFVADVENSAAKLYYDGVQVALYSLAGMDLVNGPQGHFGALFGQNETIHQTPEALVSDQILQLYQERLSVRPSTYPNFNPKCTQIIEFNCI